MSTVTVSHPLSFKTVSIASQRTVSGPRGGNKAAKKARALEMLKQGNVAYLMGLPADAREAIASNHDIALPDLGISSLSIANPDAARCEACGGVHSLDKPSKSALITFYRQGKKVFALSDSCREALLTPIAASVLTKDTLAAYRTDFPAPVKRG